MNLIFWKVFNVSLWEEVMWYRRLNDDEIINSGHYCGMLAKLLANQPQCRLAKWIEINGARMYLVTNEDIIGVTAHDARTEYSEYDFFEGRETKPDQIFDEFNFLSSIFKESL